MDFTQAFHSGDPIDRKLYTEQPAEGLPGAVRGQILKLLKTCYGLTDGLYQWFNYIVRFLCDELGLSISLLVFLASEELETGFTQVEGVIALAIDDLFHGGSIRHIDKMEQLRNRYKLGKYTWSSDRFVGKEVTRKIMDRLFSIKIFTQNPR